MLRQRGGEVVKAISSRHSHPTAGRFMSSMQRSFSLCISTSAAFEAFLEKETASILITGQSSQDRSHSWAHDSSPMTCHKLHSIINGAARPTDEQLRQAHVWQCPCHVSLSPQKERPMDTMICALTTFTSVDQTSLFEFWYIHACTSCLLFVNQKLLEKCLPEKGCKCLPEKGCFIMVFPPIFISTHPTKAHSAGFQIGAVVSLIWKSYWATLINCQPPRDTIIVTWSPLRFATHALHPCICENDAITCWALFNTVLYSTYMLTLFHLRYEKGTRSSSFFFREEETYSSPYLLLGSVRSFR